MKQAQTVLYPIGVGRRLGVPNGRGYPGLGETSANGAVSNALHDAGKHCASRHLAAQAGLQGFQELPCEIVQADRDYYYLFEVASLRDVVACSSKTFQTQQNSKTAALAKVAWSPGVQEGKCQESPPLREAVFVRV